MPEFVKGGPDIPERLLQLHEEGRLVFFCGAGISQSAGLPGFKGLVKKLCKRLSLSNDTIEEAIQKEQFDKAIELLEVSYIHGRTGVRKKIAQILTPGLGKPQATAPHEALLNLAKNRDGKTRLVTTNFDRLFEAVIENKNEKIHCFNAPLLPIPKNRWDGLVYLHGVLPELGEIEKIKEGGLEHLVISSGDYGLAYLTDRWAARFVSQLFRNYTVCFVGYGLNDSVIRYIADALAADKLQGELSLEMFAFAGYSENKKQPVSERWEAKNVTPILYRKDTTHSLLYETLNAWSEYYRDGMYKKTMIISQYAYSPPSVSEASSKLNIQEQQMLWAITDEEAAKYFANMNPVPSIEWLSCFSEERFGCKDLERFGIIPNAKDKEDDELKFSILARPSPYTHSERMHISGPVGWKSDWDHSMEYLACWLTRYINEPKLVLWLFSQGDQPNEKFKRLIYEKIICLGDLKKESHHNKEAKQKLQEIQKNAPDAIPNTVMRTVWELILSNRCRPRTPFLNFYEWQDAFNKNGLSDSLRIHLQELLTPYIKIIDIQNRQPDNSNQAQYVRDIFYCSVELSSHDFFYSMLNIREDSGDFNTKWKKASPELLQDFSNLLQDVLDLKQALGSADNSKDHSYRKIFAISDPPEEDNFTEWTILVYLTRDAWLATISTDPDRAKRFAEEWWCTPYPLFKRLAFFAAANSDVITPSQAVDWLLNNECEWLWSIETQKETIRLLVALAPKLDTELMDKIEKAILKGPVHKISTISVDPQKTFDYQIWLRLAKMKKYGAPVSTEAKARLNELQNMHEFELAEDESDEYPIGPTKITHGWVDNSIKNLSHAINELCNQADNDEWLTKKWNKVLRELNNERDDKPLGEYWPKILPVLKEIPTDKLTEISHDLSRFLKTGAKTFDIHEDIFFSLIHSILNLEYADDEFSSQENDLVHDAINHSVGYITDALLNWWYRQNPKKAEGLHEKIKPVFTEICNRPEEQFRHGRLLLAMHVINVFLVDENWTKEYFLRFFNWQSSQAEACAAWQGFSLRRLLHRPLLLHIKKDFLETAKHYKKLGEHAGSFASILVLAALDREDTFTVGELRKATGELPEEGLIESLMTLLDTLKGAEEQREEYWCNRILPYLETIWPQSNKIKNRDISTYMGLLCTETGKAFPEAVDKLHNWLQRDKMPRDIFFSLEKTTFCKDFPEASLKFLNAIIDDNLQRWLLSCLNRYLNDIKNEDEALTTDPRFIRLHKIANR